MTVIASAQAFFEEASPEYRERVAAALPSEVVVTFELQGTGGGAWTVATEGEVLKISKRRASLADCRLSCTTDDFDALLEGRLDSRQAFATGKIRVEGDVGLVLRLGRAMLGNKTP